MLHSLCIFLVLQLIIVSLDLQFFLNLVLFLLLVMNFMYFVMYVAALAKFKDIEYSVVEGAMMFRVEIEKIGATVQKVTLSIQFIEGSAMSKLLYHSDVNNYSISSP